MSWARGSLVLWLAAAVAPAQETPPPADPPADRQEEPASEESQPSPADRDAPPQEGGQTQQGGDTPAPAPGPVPEGDPPPASGAVRDSLPGATAPGPPAVEATLPARVEAPYPASAQALEGALRALAQAHPALTALEVLGRSTAGQEILALSLRLEGPLPFAERPTLIVLEPQGPPSPAAEALVALGWSVAERVPREPALAELLARTVLVLAPALDPDVRLPEAPARSVRFERNFPSGWQPETVRAGAGSISLSEPETHAAARFLTARRSAALVLGFATPAPARPPYAGSELPERDREVLARLVAALDLPGHAPVLPWNELGSPGGSLFDFAFQACGILPLALPVEPLEEGSSAGLAAWNAEVEERVLTALALLPRLELRQEGLERLAPDTWQLDLLLHNAGLVPTLSARARARWPGADVHLEVGGAKLLATAQRAPDEVSYQDASFPAGGRTTLAAGTLAGGEQRWLRLVLEGASGAKVRVTAHSPWGGSATVELQLP